MKLALDVSAVPPRMAGAGRYIGELARRVPATGIDTTLVTRRDDAPRWHDWSTDAHVAAIVPNARPSRLLYEAVVARSQFDRSIGRRLALAALHDAAPLLRRRRS